jgi:hypothetical protein
MLQQLLDSSPMIWVFLQTFQDEIIALWIRIVTKFDFLSANAVFLSTLILVPEWNCIVGQFK